MLPPTGPRVVVIIYLNLNNIPQKTIYSLKIFLKRCPGGTGAGLTRTGDPRVPPGGALHHPGPEDGRPPGQLGQGLRVARHRGAEVHPRGGGGGDGRAVGQAVDPGEAGGEQLPRGGDGSAQDVAYSVRGPQSHVRVEAGERRHLEARRGALLQRVREQGVLHLGHVVQRRQRGAAQDERTLPVSLHLPDR